MPGFLSPRKGVPVLLIPKYSGINKGQRVPDRSKTAHRKSLVKCFLAGYNIQTDSYLEITKLKECLSCQNLFLPVHRKLF